MNNVAPLTECAVTRSIGGHGGAPHMPAHAEASQSAGAFASVRIILLLMIATLFLRMPWFGDALYHDDEGFYLTFAKAMHAGAVPYVDIWDRKPMGLFLIYWLITFIPGNAVLAYQAVAGGFAFATAYILHRIARPLHGDVASACVGIVYLACLQPLFGGGGQAPIFYNVFIALAVLLITNMQRRQLNGRQTVLSGCAAMLCCGIALTVKPTVIFECIFLGLVTAYRLLRCTDLTRVQRWSSIGLHIVIGILPTFCILAYFAGIGAFHEYWFATVESQSLKSLQPLPIIIGAARYLLLLLLPFWLMVLVGWAMMFRRRSSPEALLAMGWACAAMADFLLIPSFWDHYALGLLPPLTVLAGAVFARTRTGPIWALLVVVWAILLAGWPAPATLNSRQQLAHLMSTIEQQRKGGCLFVYDGPPVLYALSNACHVTSRLFPQHLALDYEKRAVGLDPTIEMQRIITRRPAVVAMASKPLGEAPNIATRHVLLDGLRRYYRRTAILMITDNQRKPYPVEIWALSPVGT